MIKKYSNFKELLEDFKEQNYNSFDIGYHNRHKQTHNSFGIGEASNEKRHARGAFTV